MQLTEFRSCIITKNILNFSSIKLEFMYSSIISLVVKKRYTVF